MIRRDAWSRLRETTRTTATSALRRKHNSSLLSRPGPLTVLAAAALLVPIAASSLPTDAVRLEAQPSAPVPAPSSAAAAPGARTVPGLFLSRPGVLPASLVTAPGLGTAAATVNTTTIPARVLQSYQSAQASLAKTQPSCGLQWWMLAGIGRIESGHAAGGQVDAHGTTIGRIYGPLLNGTIPGTAIIRDTDGGAYDGDSTYDRAVGPMQFLPGTWKLVGRDGNGDGSADPNNIDDAAVSAGAYLCASGGNLADPARLRAAVLAYNNSAIYANDVITGGLAYRDGRTPAAPWVPSLVPGSGAPTASPLRSPGTQSAPRPSATAPRPTATTPAPTPTGSRPTAAPSSAPNTAAPTTPTGSPTTTPTGSPTTTPTGSPTTTPTGSPTTTPTGSPTTTPTGSPSMTPTGSPTTPTGSPSTTPTGSPTTTPTGSPTTGTLPPCPMPTGPAPSNGASAEPEATPGASPTCTPVPTGAATTATDAASVPATPSATSTLAPAPVPTPAVTITPRPTRR
ncbi:lytic transglycosylase domain-containing protein [Gephyromycinifex aptenodytis]|uniref:lytic transglycosylase domain-containing protein n=1 Tax=Gephyromycinifex aptenodytis TaxID=2716227 RepID=UPI001B2FEB71|nr:lytic murein transglycosylase [Gephyromycinifex aptenodytis]